MVLAQAIVKKNEEVKIVPPEVELFAKKSNRSTMMEARKMFSPNGCGSKPLLSSRANADEYVVEKILQRRKQEGCETSPSADVRAMRVVYSIFSRVFSSSIPTWLTSR